MAEYVLKIHDVIPFSNLARHGNFEYALGKERRFAFEDMCRDFSVFHDPDDNETWLQDAIEEECHRLVSHSLQEENNPFPKYLFNDVEAAAPNSNNDDFDIELLPGSIDEVIEDSGKDDETSQEQKVTPTCGLYSCSKETCLDENLFVYTIGSASIWTEAVNLIEECKLCVDEPLESCRRSSSANRRQELYRHSYFDLVEISGALFPREFGLPHTIDPDELTEGLKVCMWKDNNKEDDKIFQQDTAPFRLFEDDSVTSPSPYHEFTKMIGLAIPVYMKPVDSYSPHSRDSGKGVNFRNLILLSPQSLRNRGERSWWRHYGAVNKTVTSAELQSDLKVTEEMTMKTEGPISRRRLYSDVLTTSPSSPSASVSDVKQESAEQEQSPTTKASPCSTQAHFVDSINRFLSDFPALSPYPHSPTSPPLQSKSLGNS